jgi:hypothetical protein
MTDATNPEAGRSIADELAAHDVASMSASEIDAAKRRVEQELTGAEPTEPPQPFDGPVRLADASYNVAPPPHGPEAVRLRELLMALDAELLAREDRPGEPTGE